MCVISISPWNLVVWAIWSWWAPWGGDFGAFVVGVLSGCHIFSYSTYSMYVSMYYHALSMSQPHAERTPAGEWWIMGQRPKSSSIILPIKNHFGPLWPNWPSICIIFTSYMQIKLFGPNFFSKHSTVWTALEYLSIGWLHLCWASRNEVIKEIDSWKDQSGKVRIWCSVGLLMSLPCNCNNILQCV